jgi:hypothetical protein
MLRITLLLLLCMLAAGWAGFLFATHRALHTMDWLPLAVIVAIAILLARKIKRH